MKLPWHLPQTASWRRIMFLLTGFGSSAPVAQDTYQRFLRLQIPSSACADPHVLASIAANVGPTDLLFCVTYSGETRDIIEALETARARQAATIVLTSVPRSSAALLSDIVLLSAVSRKPYAAETVASRIAQLAVVDVVTAIIALRKKTQLRGGRERIEKELSKKRVSYSPGEIENPLPLPASPLFNNFPHEQL